jgi:peptidoglycan/LPS O-acetylase OafA/YrhL
VISGFLITRLIKEQVEAKAFSFKEFYMRRARRLLPALLVTTAASAVAGYFVLPPKLLQEFGSSAVAASLSLSNVYFFQRADYFDTDAILKPLLHTWSLGVEEQFYLVWPALLVGCRVPLDAAGCAGAGGGQLRRRRALQQHPRIGGVLPNAVSGFRVSQGLSIMGKLKVSEVAGLVPSVGTMLVIQCGTARHAGRILSNKLAVGIGVISYSIYLVHWPLVVYLKYDKFEDFSTLERWFLVGAALFCAGCSTA